MYIKDYCITHYFDAYRCLCVGNFIEIGLHCINTCTFAF